MPSATRPCRISEYPRPSRANIVASGSAKRSAISPASTKLGYTSASPSNRRGNAVSIRSQACSTQSPAALLQEPAAAGDPAHRRSQVAPEEEPERLPERAACGALRFAAAQPRAGGRRSRPPRNRRLCRPCTRQPRGARDPRPPTAPRDEPPTARRTRHPTSDARTSRGLALLDRRRPSAPRYAQACGSGAATPRAAWAACGSARSRTSRRSGRRASTSSSCEPSSTMRPSSTTAMRSARIAVASRWAMMIAVRPSSSASSARSICASDSQVEVRRRLVEHEHARLGRGTPGRARAAGARRPTATRRARARACRCPSGSRSTSSSRPTASASPRAPRRRSRRGGRRRCCRGSEPSNRNGSCGTTPSWPRSDSSVTSRRSWPSIRTRPSVRVVEAGDELGDRRLARAGRRRRARTSRPARSSGRRRGAPARRGRSRTSRASSPISPSIGGSSCGVRRLARRSAPCEQVAQLVDRRLALLVRGCRAARAAGSARRTPSGRARTRSARRR